MTSVMALFWALEPSADSLPAGQARPDAFALLPGSAPPGCSVALVGSEPHAARLRVASAARAASPIACRRIRRRPTRELKRRFTAPAASLWAASFCFVIRVLHKRGASPLANPAPHRALGLARKVRHARPPRCGERTRMTCPDGPAKMN